jgi:very-short-patch-repair endonuclease
MNQNRALTRFAFVLDQLIASIAANQCGYVLREQLIKLGLTQDAIDHRVKRGLLIPVHRGVYAVGHVPTSPQLRAYGALLATGSRSALAYDSALSAWGRNKRWHEPFEIIVVNRRRPQGIVIHQCNRLLRRDIRHHRGLRVTSPALTVLHNAPRLTEPRLIRVVNELRMEHGLKHEQLVDVATRFPRHPGARLVKPLFGLTQEKPSRSTFEDDWIPFARKYNLTGWKTNQIVCGSEVDVQFLPDHLIVELDGYATHGTKAKFRADREQDAAILDQTDIPTIRIPREDFLAAPKYHADRIHRLLARRRSRGTGDG